MLSGNLVGILAETYELSDMKTSGLALHSISKRSRSRTNRDRSTKKVSKEVYEEGSVSYVGQCRQLVI